MVVEFDEAYGIAKECVSKRTGDLHPTLLRYELKDTFFFQFRTSKGDMDIIVDPLGEVGQCFKEGPSEETEPPLTRQDAVHLALSSLGGGKVGLLKMRDGGYEVEVDRGDKGTYMVFVDREGMVHRQKCSVLTRNLAQDID